MPADILPFKKKASARGNTLCREGFHKWVVDKQTLFDVKQGRLVTSYVCKRCGKVKNEAR